LFALTQKSLTESTYAVAISHLWNAERLGLKINHQHFSLGNKVKTKSVCWDQTMTGN
jgi:hypothetical protein